MDRANHSPLRKPLSKTQEYFGDFFFFLKALSLFLMGRADTFNNRSVNKSEVSDGSDFYKLDGNPLKLRGFWIISLSDYYGDSGDGW